MRTITRGLTAVGMGTALVLAPVTAANAQPVQNGLVNVAIGDTTITFPVAVAANLCDINVNVLARQIRNGNTDCTATADANA